jgi:hypothetical protein
LKGKKASGPGEAKPETNGTHSVAKPEEHTNSSAQHLDADESALEKSNVRAKLN